MSGLAASGAPATDAGRAGFAKTMMFTGGSPEVQNLVNQAMAARAEANGSSPPDREGKTLPIATVAADQHDANATPPPARPLEAPRRTHGAAIAATMVSMPAAGRMPGGASSPAARPAEMEAGMQPTPPPVAGPPPGGAPAAAGPPKAGASAAFRETLWFKQGDVDQMVADARAKLEASKAKGVPVPEPEAVALPIVEETKPIEERYVDDGSVTTEDRKKYSLRQGATSASLPTVGGAIPGERMSAEEMMGEIGGGRRIAIIVVAVVVVAAVVAIVAVGFRGKKVAQNAAALTSSTVPAQPAAPAAAPPAAAAPAAPTPSAPAPAAPAAAAAAGDDDAPSAPSAKSHGGSHKHASAKPAAKKAKGKHHH